jgi:hypothetical protein
VPQQLEEFDLALPQLGEEIGRHSRRRVVSQPGATRFELDALQRELARAPSLRRSQLAPDTVVEGFVRIVSVTGVTIVTVRSISGVICRARA